MVQRLGRVRHRVDADEARPPRGKPLGEREREIERLEKRIKAEATERKQQEPEYLVLREGGDMERFPFGEPD